MEQSFQLKTCARVHVKYNYLQNYGFYLHIIYMYSYLSLSITEQLFYHLERMLHRIMHIPRANLIPKRYSNFYTKTIIKEVQNLFEHASKPHNVNKLSWFISIQKETNQTTFLFFCVFGPTPKARNILS